jgi:hypothetical protein
VPYRTIVWMAKRKASKPPQRPAARESNAGSETVLPMDIQVGDRFTEQGFEWEVLTHPTAMHGAKTLRARVVRPGLPESEREVTWPAHQHIAIRRGTSSAP